jgi:hypothetical protein
MGDGRRKGCDEHQVGKTVQQAGKPETRPPNPKLETRTPQSRSSKDRVTADVRKEIRVLRQQRPAGLRSGAPFSNQPDLFLSGTFAADAVEDTCSGERHVLAFAHYG